MKTEVKVGAFTLIGILLAVGVFAMFSNFKLGGNSSYHLNIQFSQVIGVSAGNSVCYAGYKVGTIERIVPDGAKVTVVAKIDSDVKVPKKSKITITSSGVMGAKFINIQPDVDADFNDCYRDGDTLNGNEEAGLGSIMDNINMALSQVRSLLNNMNDLFGNKDMKQAVLSMSANMRDITGNLRVMSASLANMAVDNEADIRQMVQNLNKMTGSLMKASASVEQLVSTFNGDGVTGENLKQAVANLNATSKSIEKMASSLEGIVTDPQVASDLKATLHNVRGVSENADSMMKKINKIEVKAGLETMYSGKNKDWMTDLDVNISPNGKEYLKLGVNDIGEDNRIDAQIGTRSGSIGGHAGVIDSKAGIGIDAGSDKLKLSLDAYDPNDFRLKSRLQYEVADDTYVFTQVNDINKSDSRKTYFGLRKEF